MRALFQELACLHPDLMPTQKLKLTYTNSLNNPLFVANFIVLLTITQWALSDFAERQFDV